MIEIKILEKVRNENLLKSEIMKDDLVIDDEEDENDYIFVDFDFSDEDEKDGDVDDKNDLLENLEILFKVDVFIVKNEIVFDLFIKIVLIIE